jgi:hypothetical protein
MAVQHFLINYIKKACWKVSIPETSVNPATVILLPVGRIYQEGFINSKFMIVPEHMLIQLNLLLVNKS